MSFRINVWVLIKALFLKSHLKFTAESAPDTKIFRCISPIACLAFHVEFWGFQSQVINIRTIPIWLNLWMLKPWIQRADCLIP